MNDSPYLIELHNRLWTETQDSFRDLWSTDVTLTEDEWNVGNFSIEEGV